MLIAIQPKYSVLQVMGHMKGKSFLMIFDRFAHMIQVQQQTLLVQRVLCRYGRTQSEKDRRDLYC